MNEQHQSEPLESVSSFERYVPAHEYDANYYELYYPEEGFLRFELELRTAKALRYAQLQQGMRVLDIGCGPGDLVEACAEAKCLVWGVDYSTSAIDIAKKRIIACPDEIAGRVTLGVMNAKGLGFPSDIFDIAYMTDVVEHLYPEEFEQVLKEVIRVLRKPGRLIIRTAPNAWLVKPIYRIGNFLLGTDSWDSEFYHVNEWSPLYVKPFVRDAGVKYKLIMGKANDNYFFGHLPTVAGPFLQNLARAIDKVLDSSFGKALVFKTPLKFILGTEIWVIIDL